MLDTANEQRISEIDGNEVFVYLIDKIHFEQTFIDISNDLFKDSILAPVSDFIFVYSEDSIEDQLSLVINDIRTANLKKDGSTINKIGENW